jgi:hypothetical protein
VAVNVAVGSVACVVFVSFQVSNFSYRRALLTAFRSILVSLRTYSEGVPHYARIAFLPILFKSFYFSSFYHTTI